MTPAEKAAARDKIAALRMRWIRLADEWTRPYAATRAHDAYLRALEKTCDELTAPEQEAMRPTPVKRPHCNRCDRCGWMFRTEDTGCVHGNCSMRPLPPLRAWCAGCSAPFEEDLALALERSITQVQVGKACGVKAMVRNRRVAR
jgi:hypothetical protein